MALIQCNNVPIVLSKKHKKTNEDIAMRNGIVRDEIGQAEALSEDLVKKIKPWRNNYLLSSITVYL